jgi:hypothetical protein
MNTIKDVFCASILEWPNHTDIITWKSCYCQRKTVKLLRKTRLQPNGRRHPPAHKTNTCPNQNLPRFSSPLGGLANVCNERLDKLGTGSAEVASDRTSPQTFCQPTAL